MHKENVFHVDPCTNLCLHQGFSLETKFGKKGTLYFFPLNNDDVVEHHISSSPYSTTKRRASVNIFNVFPHCKALDVLGKKEQIANRPVIASRYSTNLQSVIRFVVSHACK